MKRRMPKPGEVYAYYIRELGKYGTCQVLDVDLESKSICQVTLDYLRPEPPAADRLEEIRPFYRESFRMHHQMEKSLINHGPVPADYRFIGTCSLKTDSKCSSYSGRWPSGEAYCYEERWRNFDEKARTAYKKYINSGDTVTVHGELFRKNTGGLVDRLYQKLTEEDSLEHFPCITYAEVTGWSKKLERWLCETPLLAVLRLKNAETETLDLRETHLDHLQLELDGVRTLILPPTLRSLRLWGKADPELKIDDRLCKRNLSLFLSLKKAALQKYGLSGREVQSLFLEDIKELDLEAAAEAFPEIEALRLVGSPGILLHTDALGRLKKLRTLSVTDLFGYEARDLEALEQLTELRELDLESIPREAGIGLKKRWKNRLDRLLITKLRGADWLRENLENPLRHWDGNEFIPRAACKSAFKCYKDTKKQLLAAGSREQIEEIARQFTMHFNRLNERYEEFIETAEREDIFQAMEQLYEECVLFRSGQEAPLTLDELWDVMEEVRGDW